MHLAISKLSSHLTCIWPFADIPFEMIEVVTEAFAASAAPGNVIIVTVELTFEHLWPAALAGVETAAALANNAHAANNRTVFILVTSSAGSPSARVCAAQAKNIGSRPAPTPKAVFLATTRNTLMNKAI